MKQGYDKYEAFKRAGRLSSALRRAKVHSLDDAITEEQLGNFDYQIAEKVDSFLERLLEKHPEYCMEISTMEELHRRICRGKKNLDPAMKA